MQKSRKINKKQSILFEKHMYFCIDLIHGIFLHCSIRQDRKIQNYVYWRETLRIKNLFFITLIICVPYVSMSSEQIASTKYVENIVNSIRTDSITSESTNIQIPSAKAVWQLNATISNSLTQHISNNANPHSVSAAQVGLGNVKNIDTTPHPSKIRDFCHLLLQEKAYLLSPFISCILRFGVSATNPW